MKVRKYGKSEKREKLTALLFVSPLMIGFIVFTLISMAMSVAYGFTNYNPVVGRMDFVGFAQFNNLFTHPTYKRAFLDSIANTLFLLLATPLSIVISLFLASLMNSKRLKGKTFFRVIIYLPAVTSVVAVNYVWRYMFEDHGILNSLFGTCIDWLNDLTMIKVAMIVKNIWGGIGTQVILFMVGMANIPTEYYEAADLDGAGVACKFFRIMLPLITPVLFYTVVTGLIGGFQIYADVQLFAAGQYGARTIVYFIWQRGIGTNNYGLASAASFLLAAVIMIITLIQFRFSDIWIERME